VESTSITQLYLCLAVSQEQRSARGPPEPSQDIQTGVHVKICASTAIAPLLLLSRLSVLLCSSSSRSLGPTCCTRLRFADRKPCGLFGTRFEQSTHKRTNYAGAAQRSARTETHQGRSKYTATRAGVQAYSKLSWAQAGGEPRTEGQRQVVPRACGGGRAAQAPGSNSSASGFLAPGPLHSPVCPSALGPRRFAPRRQPSVRHHADNHPQRGVPERTARGDEGQGRHTCTLRPLPPPTLAPEPGTSPPTQASQGTVISAAARRCGTCSSKPDVTADSWDPR